MEEKRKNKRLDLQCKLLLKRLDGTRHEEVSVEVIDASKTGIGFLSERTLQIGAVYEAYLTIWTKEVVHAFIELVRVNGDGEEFEYGGIFIGMPQTDVQRIQIYETLQEET